MPRRPRFAPHIPVFHVLNRAVARLPLFEKPEDYESFERVLHEAWERDSLPLYSYCIMPNHWHFVVCPDTKNQVSIFSAGLRTPIRCVGTLITTPKGQGICTKADLRLSLSKTMCIFWRSCVALNAIPFEQGFANVLKIGNMEVHGASNTAIQSSRVYSRSGQFLDRDLGLPMSMSLNPIVNSKPFAGVWYAVHPLVPILG